MLRPNGVKPSLDLFHVVEILDRSLFAGRDDQALLAVHQWDLRDLLDGDEALVVLRCRANVDERAETVVLAEVAARIFVARGAVFDFADGLQANKSCLLAIAPQPQRFLRSTDRTRFAAMLVDDDLRLFPGGAETVADEIHFGFHYGEVVLRSALEHEA